MEEGREETRQETPLTKEETLFDRVEVELLSSPEEFRRWTEMTPCQDFKNQLQAWLKDIQIALEDSDGILMDKSLHRLGGNAQMLRYVLGLFDVTLANLEDDIRNV